MCKGWEQIKIVSRTNLRDSETGNCGNRTSECSCSCCWRKHSDFFGDFTFLRIINVCIHVQIPRECIKQLWLLVLSLSREKCDSEISFCTQWMHYWGELKNTGDAVWDGKKRINSTCLINMQTRQHNFLLLAPHQIQSLGSAHQCSWLIETYHHPLFLIKLDGKSHDFVSTELQTSHPSKQKQVSFSGLNLFDPPFYLPLYITFKLCSI